MELMTNILLTPPLLEINSLLDLKQTFQHPATRDTSTFLLCIRLLPIPFELAVSSSFGFSLNIPGRHI